MRGQKPQHCNPTVPLGASQAAVLLYSPATERGEVLRLSPCVGGRGKQASAIIYPFTGDAAIHVAPGMSPGPASSLGGLGVTSQESHLWKPSLHLITVQLGALRGQRSNTVNVSKVSTKPITRANVCVLEPGGRT